MTEEEDTLTKNYLDARMKLICMMSVDGTFLYDPNKFPNYLLYLILSEVRETNRLLKTIVEEKGE